jgi:hypothetical protein
MLYLALGLLCTDSRDRLDSLQVRQEDQDNPENQDPRVQLARMGFRVRREAQEQ